MSGFIPRHSINTARWSKSRTIGFLVFAPVFVTYLSVSFAVAAFAEAHNAPMFGIWPLLLLPFLWQSYVTNYWEAGDIRMRWQRVPRKEWGRVRGRLWAPTALSCLLAFSCVIAWIALAVTGKLKQRELFTVAVGLLIGIICAALFAYIAIIIQPKIKRRFERSLRLRQICRECGYDLHAGLMPSCPECGEPIPWLTAPEA